MGNRSHRGGTAQSVQRQTERSGAILAWVRFLGAVRDFSPGSAFNADSVTAGYGVYTAPGACSRVHHHKCARQKHWQLDCLPSFGHTNIRNAHSARNV